LLLKYVFLIAEYNLFHEKIKFNLSEGPFFKRKYTVPVPRNDFPKMS
jgi:hypothetical protein